MIMRNPNTINRIIVAIAFGLLLGMFIDGPDTQGERACLLVMSCSMRFHSNRQEIL